jgi:hypothetical protein
MKWQIADDKSQMIGSERRRGEVTQFGRAKQIRRRQDL